MRRSLFSARSTLSGGETPTRCFQSTNRFEHTPVASTREAERLAARLTFANMSLPAVLPGERTGKPAGLPAARKPVGTFVVGSWMMPTSRRTSGDAP